MKATITKGQDFTLPIQLGTEPYAERLKIESSDTSNPCAVTTQLPHQKNDGDTVRISDHRKNTVINGTHIVTVVSPFVFTVPVEGAIVGDQSGFVSLLKDISDYEFTIAVKNYKGGTALTGVTATISITDTGNRIVTVEILSASTLLLQSKSCVLVVSFTDDNGKKWIFTVECEVKDA